MRNLALEKAIQVLGGPSETSYLLRVSYWTIREWRKAGRVRDSLYAVRLADAAQAAGAPEVTIRALAGVAEIGVSPNGGEEASRSGSSRTCPDVAPHGDAAPLIDAPLAHAA